MIKNEIYEVPANRRYWMVRSSGGHYYNHFTSNNCIGIGHLNVLVLDSCHAGELNSTETELRHALRLKGFEKKKFEKHSRQLKQAVKFIHEMAIGDWIITVGQAGYRYGLITSRAYIERRPVTLEGQSRNFIGDADMHLRRNVDWGPVIRREHLPYGLAQAFKARQTVTCLDEHWQALYHSIYPAFIANNNLHLSIKIGTENPVSNYAVMNLFKILNEIEIIGKDYGAIEQNGFEAVFDEYIENDSFSTTTKAQFHSPGDVWAVVTSAVEQYSWIAPALVAYGALFGNKFMGMDGLLDLESRRKIWDLVIERLKKDNAVSQIESLNLSTPEKDTSVLEQKVERNITVDTE